MKFNDPMSPPMIAKLPKLLLIVLMIPFLLRNSVTELKGRELRTLVAAPGRGRPQEHNSRARGRVLLAGLEANNLPGFRRDRSQSYANLRFCFVFYIRFGTSRVTMRFYALHRNLPRIISEIFNTLVAPDKCYLGMDLDKEFGTQPPPSIHR